MPFLIRLAIFASGLSALIYQILWVRQFGMLLGNTIDSAAVVTGTFMLGLGWGSVSFGRWADRLWVGHPGRLLRWYAAIELGIGCWAMALGWLFPHWGDMAPWLSSYRLGDGGWMELSWSTHVLRVVTAMILILPITFLMGGTLTVLIRYALRRSVRDAGSWTALIYAINTAGAAVGCLAVDFLLVPYMGLLTTHGVAAALNLSAFFMATKLAREEGTEDVTRCSVMEGGGSVGESEAMGFGVRGVAWVLGITGFVGMAMEMVWFRYLGSLLGGTRGVFALLLATVLGGIWLGALVGGVMSRRRGWAWHGFVLSQGLFLLSCVGGLLCIDRGWLDTSSFRGAFDVLGAWHAQTMVEWVYVLRLTCVAAVLPAFFSGMLFPLASALTQNAPGEVGSRAGVLYMANTLGALAGAMLCGFLYIPRFGMQQSILVLLLTGLVGLLVSSRILFLRDGFRSGSRAGWSTWGSLALGLVATLVWVPLPAQQMLTTLFDKPRDPDGFVVLSEGASESVAIDQHPLTGIRKLLTDGHAMSGVNLASQRYMRAMVHWPLLQVTRNARVAVICFGVGNTAHAASLHPNVTELQVIDRSRHVLSHASYFEEWNRGVLKDPRVQVYINDGRLHLRMSPRDHFDLITLEPPPIAKAGVSALYTREFYELARERLREGGFVTQWLPALQEPPEVIDAMIRAFLDVFPNAILLHGFDQNFILMGRKSEEQRVSALEMSAVLKQRPEVMEDLRRIKMGTLVELLGSFVAGSGVLDERTRGVDPVTDDLPLMENSFVVFLESALAETIWKVEEMDRWCSDCHLAQEPLSTELGTLRSYRGIMWIYYRTMPKASYIRPPLRHEMLLPLVDEDITAAVERSPFLQALFNGGQGGEKNMDHFEPLNGPKPSARP